jgi:hypothetical protein
MLGSIIIIVVLWRKFLVPHQRPSRTIELGSAKVPVSLILTYPNYIAGGDQGYIDVTMCNEGDRPISRNVVVDFHDHHHVVCMNCSEKNELEFKDLAPRVRQTWRIGFVMNETPSCHLYWSALPPVQFDVKVVDGYGNGIAVFSDQEVKLAPIPYLRTFLSSGFITALLTLPIEWLKKRLGPE